MSEINTIINELLIFSRDREWEQFHNSKDLAMALNIEAGELLEQFLWKSAEEANPEKINGLKASWNSNVNILLEKNIIGFHKWNCNIPNIIPFLEKNPELIDWYYLSENPNASSLLEKNQEKLDSYHWRLISRYNNNIEFLEKNIDHLKWNALSTNPHAVSLLEKNLDKIEWNWLCSNENAVHLIEENFNKITNYSSLVRNSEAIHLIERVFEEKNDNYQQAMFYHNLSINPAIFEDDDYCCK